VSQTPSTAATPVICVEKDRLDALEMGDARRSWLGANDFSGQNGKLVPLPGEGGANLDGYAFGTGIEAERNPLVTGLAAAQLPAGRYRLEGQVADEDLFELGFRLGAYRFERYKTGTGAVELESRGRASAEVAHLAEAAFIARDLINTPANDLGPEAFGRAIAQFADERGMAVDAVVGDELLAENFPMVHAVGRASAEAPRLLDLRWGRQDAPRVTLVGKGVTFDTGGLDIKPASGMLLMKKDMGGAANILGLAHAIVAARLDVRLRVIIPVVENAIAGSSFRPGDILPSRNGMTVEIGNTDAEGRLILADALTLASEEDPQLIIDMATLTGAARVALGPDLPPIYSANSDLAGDMVEQGMKWGDPVWQLPLWAPYDNDLTSSVADVSHIGSGPFAGSITAALFLQRFVKTGGDWVHCDIYGWTPAAKPGRPKGGADQAIRAAFGAIRKRFG